MRNSASVHYHLPSRSGLTVVVEELAALVVIDEEDGLGVHVGVGLQRRDELRRPVR